MLVMGVLPFCAAEDATGPILVTVLGVVAEFEREMMLARSRRSG